MAESRTTECDASKTSNGRNVSTKADIPEDRAEDNFANGWFARLVGGLFTRKAGTALHCISGFDERACQRYAAGHVKPPAYFLRALLRSAQGFQFLAAIMDGSDAAWWADLQRAKRVMDAIDRER